MRAVGIVGSSGSGKTTLVEALVPRLDGRVATVKSIHHTVEIDDPGTDTHRHRTAGADKVVGVTPALTFAIEPTGKDDHPTDWPSLRRVLADLECDGIDTVLVEGFTASPLPKIVVGAMPESIEGAVIRTVADPGTIDIDAIQPDIDDLGDWTSYAPGPGRHSP